MNTLFFSFLNTHSGGLAHFIEAIFLFSICMTYPLIIFPMRDSLEILVMKLQCVNEAARKNGECQVF